MTRWIAIPALALVLSFAVAGCGNSQPTGEKPVLKVSAAASLQDAFERYAKQFGAADAQLQFAGSDALAAQIRHGARPAVFAAANTKLPGQLHDEGLVETPVVFATNELVIAVPSGSTSVKSLADLDRRGVKIAAGSASVPVGSYTRQVLGKLPPAERDAVLANIRSSEPDVKGVVGKVSTGAVDAGFVYSSDVRASGGRLRAIALPKNLEPVVAYGIAVVKGSDDPSAAAKFVDRLLSASGQKILRDAGFGPPPS
jgi:molybdate transport system substrate-binding protein